MPTSIDPALVHLRSGGVSLVLNTADGGVPEVVYWGADLGADELDAGAVIAVSRPVAPASTPEEARPPSLLPEPSAGWFGEPGIAGHRGGRAFTTRLKTRAFATTHGPGTGDLAAESSGSPVGDAPADAAPAVGERLAVDLADDRAELAVTLVVELTPAGLVRARADVTNTGADPYTLDALQLTLPLPSRAAELLDFTGRHLRERAPVRQPIRTGVHRRVGRRGRTGLDATLLMVAGTPSFTFRTGEVWAIHTAWSGDHVTYAERTTAGGQSLGGGEYLLPGEGMLEPGQTYRSPWILGSYSATGLDSMAHRFHAYLRDGTYMQVHRPGRPEPVIANSWEAVYFDHDLARLTRLVDLAAGVGAERFVLDDGWFQGRRSDTTSLGDWRVDHDVWPQGLAPLVDHVRDRGLEFGLWVEPEMVSADSELARAHPEWILAPGDDLPLEARHQQVLNLANPDAYAHVLAAIDAIVGEYGVDYLKWDHNRDLVEPGDRLTGRAVTRRQTLAAYALMDELKARHPGLRIESCSSGGGRADAEVLRHTDRLWASDCIDPIERQSIQAWTGLLVPPELIGAHVGAAEAHTTGRHTGLDFRCGTALLASFGMEWDLAAATDAERSRLASWVAVHRQIRTLIAAGDLVHADHPDPAYRVYGIVAPDRYEAVFVLACLETSEAPSPGRILLPGLDEAVRYTVTRLVPADPAGEFAVAARPAWLDDGVQLDGRILTRLGVQGTVLVPGQLDVWHLRRAGGGPAGCPVRPSSSIKDEKGTN